MSTTQRELVTHVFQGPRFEDHGLDLDVLPDLVAYKTLLVETAKELWRRKNPDRERLPKNFEASLVLKFYSIGAGSVQIPLMREFQTDDDSLPYAPAADELDEAVVIIADSVSAAAEDRPLPELLPKQVMPLFAEYGKTLRAGESILQKPWGRTTTATYTPEVRQRLANWTPANYEDRVDLVGEVRSADVEGCSFTIRLDGTTKVPGKFRPDQEKRITDALCEHASRRLRIVGRAEFSAVSHRPTHILSVDTVEDQILGETAFDADARPIWDVAADIAADVADSEWERVPTDLSPNVDHYLFGATREEE